MVLLRHLPQHTKAGASRLDHNIHTTAMNHALPDLSAIVISRSLIDNCTSTTRDCHQILALRARVWLRQTSIIFNTRLFCIFSPETYWSQARRVTEGFVIL